MVKTESGEALVEQKDDENVQDKSSKKVKLDQPDIDDETKSKIVKQLEYYFSDVNLFRDKFMQEHLSKNGNRLKLSVLLTFSRLAQLTKNEDIIVKALENHQSDVIELDVDKREILRKKPIPDREKYKEGLDMRTVHISGFPDTVPFEALEKFCNQYGDIESLMMRKHFKTKQFKGCIHVVYKDVTSAKKVLENEELKFKDRELRRESMEQYYKRKEEIREKRKKSKGANKDCE